MKKCTFYGQGLSLIHIYLPDRRVGLMHGKLKPKEKAEVMDDFKSGRLDALVSTTVIEVGVDVPNATVMVIELSLIHILPEFPRKDFRLHVGWRTIKTAVSALLAVSYTHLGGIFFR